MNGHLFDSSVLLDLITADPVWLVWSKAQLDAAAMAGTVRVNPIIYAEIAPEFDAPEELDGWLNPAIFQRLDLPYEAGWLAGKAHARYRRAGGARRSTLPDFYIGAHAEVSNLTLVTRDPTRIATYFPRVKLINP